LARSFNSEGLEFSIFTLNLVRGMQRLFSPARTFIFVDDVVEVTERFHDHPLEEAPQLVFGGRLLEVDPISDYGRSFGRFVDEYLGAVNHRSTLLILDGGRGDGKDAGLAASNIWHDGLAVSSG
jgi:uncharacterized protein